MPNPDYPPAFSQNAISSAIGQINDFSGTESSSSKMMLKSAAAPAGGDQSLASLATSEGAIPVVITGSRPQNPVHFPGLRETMIGAAIVQLADQIPAENPLREKIRELALDLHAQGAEKIVRSRKSGGKPRRK